MTKVILCCSAGMSTSLLVKKMQDVAKERGTDIAIQAMSEADVKNHEDEMDVLLLGPQVRFKLKEMKEKYEGKGIPVDVIDTVAYGTMNGSKVLDQALKMAGK
ncbi:MAG: PTS sugar transporter subunit IIB [Clostridium sp.]|nr:PTS sugar transporter subunit IIB [Clostridium sp.]